MNWFCKRFSIWRGSPYSQVIGLYTLLWMFHSVYLESSFCCKGNINVAVFSINWCIYLGRGGGGDLTKFYMRRLRTKVQPLTPHIPFFERKGTPFVHLPLKNDTPFTYLCNNVVSLSLNPGNELNESRVQSMRDILIKRPYIPKWKICLSFYILKIVKSLPFHIPEGWKKYPFRAEPPRIAHYREYPPGAYIVLLWFSSLSGIFFKPFKTS